MTTLEKAARALCEELFGPYDPEDMAPSSISRQARLGAAAAISAALLDPSDDVVTAGVEAYLKSYDANLTAAIRAVLHAAGVKIIET